jgi:transposase
VQLGLSNSRLEGINAKIRLIQRRGFGNANPDNLKRHDLSVPRRHRYYSAHPIVS